MTAGRLGAPALAAAGAFFVLYPATRPWHDESTETGAIAAMTSPAWIASHLFAVLGFVLATLGLLAIWQLLRHTDAGRTALVAVVVGWLGVGLTLPYYGAETFGLHAIAGRAATGQQFDLLETAIAGRAAAGQQFDLLETVESVRFGAVAATTFGVGLVGLGAAAVLAAIAVWRSSTLPRFSGVLFATGLVMFIPQFYAPPAIRIGHGLLLGAGAVWLAAALWRTGRTTAPALASEPPTVAARR